MTQQPIAPTADPEATTADGSAAFVSSGHDPKSIVDAILDLDELMSADVRRAEKTFRFYTRPDLEATIEELNGRYDAVTDAHGRPLVDPDASVSDTESPASIRAEILTTQQAYAASAIVGRVTQMPEDDWQAYLARHKSELDKVGNVLGEAKPVVVEDLIVKSRARLVDPHSGRQGEPFTVSQIKTFRTKFGHPAFWEVALAAWQVNSSSGVAIPKSLISSPSPRPS